MAAGSASRALHAARTASSTTSAPRSVSDDGLRGGPSPPLARPCALVVRVPEADPVIEAFAGAFPAFTPYGGEFEDIVPHVTVARGDERLFAGIERQLAPQLPIRSRATEVALYAFADARWQPQASFSLNRHDAVAES